MSKYNEVLKKQAQKNVQKKVQAIYYFLMVIIVNISIIIAWILTFQAIARWKKELEQARIRGLEHLQETIGTSYALEQKMQELLARTSQLGQQMNVFKER